MNNFFNELRRRKVVRVAGVYGVAGWVLLQIATTLEESMNLPVWFDGLVVALLFLGFPIALIFAWAFELTPDGVVRAESVADGQGAATDAGRKLDYVIILGIAILGVVILVKGNSTPDIEAVPEQSTDIAVEASPDTLLDKSIAVLPFENRSPNADDAFFASGVHDDLLTHLSKIADMHVISRTSVMGYAGTDRKIPDIGRELGVATVMEGAVQRAGNRVRINVQLIDVETDNHIWAEIYDRDLTADNIFEIQSEITKAIASALNAALSDTDEAALAQRPTQNLAAYDAFITGRSLSMVYERGADSLLESIDHFNEAISHDPQFGQAYAGRAFSELSLHWYTAEPGDWVANARESLRMATRYAPDAVETHTARGYYHYWGHLDYVAADAEFDIALEISPHYPPAIAGKAFAARRAGRFEEAITLLEMGARLDPLGVDVQTSLIESLRGLGRFEKASAAYTRATAANEDMARKMAAQENGDNLLQMGDLESAWRFVETLPEDRAELYFMTRAKIAVMTRDPDKMRHAMDEWPEDKRSPGFAPEVYNIARAEVMLALGETEAAKALFTEIKARIDSSDNPYPSGWQPNAMYLPVELPGYVGDLDGVRKTIAAFEETRSPDAWAEVDYLQAYASALLWADAPADEALDYVDRMVEIRGPYIYLPLSIEPAFDAVRDHPRYLALKAKYEAWAAEQAG
jgi:TolB-like protein